MLAKAVFMSGAGLAVWALYSGRALAVGSGSVEFKRMESVEKQNFDYLPSVRGFRNNNPGNIEYHAYNQWKGQTGSDGRYAVFSDMSFGIRALGKLLETYRNKYARVTVRQIIERWAPDFENNTESYIASVSDYAGIGANDYIEDWANMKPRIVAAIIKHENGSQPFDHDYIVRSLAL